jgi:hypothetical protein
MNKCDVELQAGAAAHKVAAELADRMQLSSKDSEAAGSHGPRHKPEPEPEPGVGSRYVVPPPVAGAPHLLQPRHVISLGSDCFCRTQATRMGYVRRRVEGYASGPFDIAYHSYSAVCSLLQNDFASYMGALRLLLS